MARHTTGTVVIHPTLRRNPGALLRTLASLATASALVELAITSTRSADNRLIVGVIGAMAGIYSLLTYSRWRSRNRIEVGDGFVMVYTTAERRGVWFRRADIRCLAADHHDLQVIGAQGVVPSPMRSVVAPAASGHPRSSPFRRVFWRRSRSITGSTGSTQVPRPVPGRRLARDTAGDVSRLPRWGDAENP
jgi:hypothetical protein